MRVKWLAVVAFPAVLGAGALLTVGVAAPRLADLPGNAAKTSVDVELVLAVDVSYSMDLDELALQREGYVQALTSPDFLNAVRQGMHGKVAVTYFEWAGEKDQRVVADWHVVDGEASARVLAGVIANAPIRRSYRTSISGALGFAMPMFETSGQRGIRRVIDVSGDGANNQGPPVTTTRDEVLAKGITINGLPIMLKRPNSANMDLEDLDIYYEDCVIGGAGSFVIPIKEREKFKEAIRTKMVLEIAGREPPARVIPASSAAPRISCMIGERMWQYRWGGRDGN
jgi:hypothetical protein